MAALFRSIEKDPGGWRWLTGRAAFASDFRIQHGVEGVVAGQVRDAEAVDLCRWFYWACGEQKDQSEQKMVGGFWVRCNQVAHERHRRGCGIDL
jgi:hypothetical protein